MVCHKIKDIAAFWNMWKMEIYSSLSQCQWFMLTVTQHFHLSNFLNIVYGLPFMHYWKILRSCSGISMFVNKFTRNICMGLKKRAQNKSEKFWLIYRESEINPFYSRVSWAKLIGGGVVKWFNYYKYCVMYIYCGLFFSVFYIFIFLNISLFWQFILLAWHM